MSEMEKPSQILIVEDDVDLAEMLNAYFRVQGYEVLTASWGEDAVRMAREIVPDVVLLDIRLPDFDGYEVCKQLRQHRRTSSIPVIFLTEKRERSDKLAGLELGAVDYITKPFDIQELRLRVRNTLRRAAQSPSTNPVTGLPERSVVDERLRGLLDSDGWAILIVSLTGVADFREQYGFVAADDVLRAVSLMLINAVRETAAEEDLVGHLEADDFVVVARPEHARALEEKALQRLRSSIRFFYPIKDREHIEATGGPLGVATGTIVQGGDRQFASVDDLKTALLRARKAV